MEAVPAVAFIALLALVFPIGILIAFLRRRSQRKRYYANPTNEGEIQGSLEELNKVDPEASPWRNDEIARIRETMDLVERFDTMRGFTEAYVEDLKTELRNKGIASESIFLEGYPIGALASLTTRMGIIELYAERAQIRIAREVVTAYQSR